MSNMTWAIIKKVMKNEVHLLTTAPLSEESKFFRNSQKKKMLAKYYAKID
jgi:hypothetical protein